MHGDANPPPGGDTDFEGPKLPEMGDTQLRILLDHAHGTIHLNPIVF